MSRHNIIQSSSKLETPQKPVNQISECFILCPYNKLFAHKRKQKQNNYYNMNMNREYILRQKKAHTYYDSISLKCAENLSL